jgi:hypothetical protein
MHIGGKMLVFPVLSIKAQLGVFKAIRGYYIGSETYFFRMSDTENDLGKFQYLKDEIVTEIKDFFD